MSTPPEQTDADPDERAQSRFDGEYEPAAVEPRWQRQWVEDRTYAYESPSAEAIDPDTVFTIDTPPPTVSGSLHWGHVYGATLQDFVARFERMRGKEVFFPFGYDDNGIASERLTETELEIEHQHYERREFQELCREVCSNYEAEFTQKMQALGVSIDWENTYQTIEPSVQRISQRSFIDLYEQGREYRQRAPTIWCPECATAISQVETEDADRPSHFHDIAFELAETGERFTIATTRPELLPACVAVFVHPDDEANASLVGQQAVVPLFGHEVPIIADERVDMEAGSGVVMCCTFGDQTDIEWYQAHDLPLRVAIDETGTMLEPAESYAGLSSREARQAIVADLDAEGTLLDRREITHTVNVHERCDTPIEFLVTEQWYIKLLDRTDEYLAAGRSMEWYPEKMFTRYKNWIEGLQWDWAISRQRSSGIPFPVWYCESCDEPVMAEKDALPVDPLSDAPPVDRCPVCEHGSFVPEEDVLDTWATSSLTPLINAGWAGESEGLDRPELYPVDMRPQGHDIISFWLFHTVVKCYEHTGEVPFESVLINGHVLDRDRRKMSKSKGNGIDPREVMDEYPIDAIRYWAASTSVGEDFPFNENSMRQGEKLLQKLWNASKLVDSLADTEPAEPDEFAAMDEWLLASLDDVIETVTAYFEAHEYAKARDELRAFFWHTFCDDYLEIAKQSEADSTPYTLRVAHRRFLKLFAPFVPHVTEELHTTLYGDDSVHTLAWPEPEGYESNRAAGETALEVISALRGYKTDNGLALNATLGDVAVYGDIEGFEDAISGVMHVETLERLDEAPAISTEVAGIDLDYSKVGPEFGSKVGAIDSAIETGEYAVSNGQLHVADEVLDSKLFEVEEERTFAGEGEFIETENAVVIVR